MLFQNDIPIDVACHRYTLNMQVSSGTKNNSSPNEPSCTTVTVVRWCSLGGTGYLVLFTFKSVRALNCNQNLDSSENIKQDHCCVVHNVCSLLRLITGDKGALQILQEDLLVRRTWIEPSQVYLERPMYIKSVEAQNPAVDRFPVAAVAEWYRHRIVAGFVTSSSPVPLKTHRVGQRCTLNLSRAETSSRWCGVVVRRGGASSGVVHVT
ncbi:uncharacterized protein TNCV_659091 [Trichonephila clavipes]|nr:uncharacterized protein TNCV_659091 [Trichonephila clavipes]